MKKMILCAVALLFGMVVYAQDIAGSPTSALVPALSGAATGANTGESIQNGNDNRVRVQQAGTSQSVYTNQNDGMGSGGNLAKIRQTGAVQPGISGEENAADVLQSGTANQAQTRQEGDFNNAVTRQGQNNDLSARNKAKIRQGTGQQAQDNRAAIDQDGDDNWAQTQQTYDNSDAWTRQIGDDNKSMIVQDAGPNQTTGHEAMNWQNGEGNESAINQSGAGARNIAKAGQIGDFNQAKQIQTTDALATEVGNRAVIAQGFPGNVLGFGDMPVLLSTRIDISNNVDADAGTVTANVPSRYNKAKQVQSGSEQEADVYQFGGTLGPSNYSEQVQAGSGNDAGISQGHLLLSGQGASAADSYAKQNQDGNENYAGLVQEGNGFKALQDQRGNSNVALSYQASRDHLLNIHQRGDENVAYSTQHGLANTALMVQRGGHSYSVQQNKDLPQFDISAGANQADILQLGPSGDFATDGIDCGFEAPMDLDMDYTIPDFTLEDVCPGC